MLCHKEIVLEHVSFTHDDPSIFVKSQWQRTKGISRYYFCIKWSIAVFFLITSVLSIIQADLDEESQATTFIYLSRWGYTLCTIQSILSVILLTDTLITRNQMLAGALYKIYWAFVEVATVVAFGITALFWSLQFNGEITVMSAIIHGANSVIMFIDLCIVAHPVRLLHCYWTVLFSVCYSLFSLVYYLAGGINRNGDTSIYPILDWSKPLKTGLLCFAILPFAIILHCFTYCIFKLRVYVASKVLQ